MSEAKSDAVWSEDMDKEAHIGTYDAFIKGATYGTIAVIAVVILLAIITL
ncbi:MAG: aa3-type cytochrome c oxidase subunit IV [Parvibaculaceae bacterium]|nr:aa3-type cytochrome c oxidase subunit IV [Parvibaculaceae bacterium]